MVSPVPPETWIPLPELVAAGAALLATVAEVLHARRVAQLKRLAFGPDEGAALWAKLTPAFRALAVAALAWGLTTLLMLSPKIHRADASIEEGPPKRLLLVLDVSPSMRLEDAGPSGEQPRMGRASDVLESFFKRVAISTYRISVVAVYNGAKPVVVDTRDLEVVRNILNDLPMHYAFNAGRTDLFAGLDEAAEIAAPWEPDSTVLMLVTDGDTVPSTGLPAMPASISDVLVIGVGDPRQGSFIDGQQSRQDVATLRQLAVRLKGTYHDANEKHIPSALIASLGRDSSSGDLVRLTRREYALIAIGLSALVLAALPPLLQHFGTAWRPGVRFPR